MAINLLIVLIYCVQSTFSFDRISDGSSGYAECDTREVLLAVGGSARHLNHAESYHILRSTEMYDPERDVWSFVRPPPVWSYNFGITVSHNLVYLCGGSARGQPDSSVKGGFAYYDIAHCLTYDPMRDEWHNSSVAEIPCVTYSWNLVTLNDTIYGLAGGHHCYHKEICRSRIEALERYDPVTDKWQFVTETMRYLNSGPVFTSVEKHGIYVAESWQRGRFYRYDVSSDLWTQLASLPESRSSFVMVNVKVDSDHDYILALGGVVMDGKDDSDRPNLKTADSVEVYHVQANEWLTPLPYALRGLRHMKHAISEHTAAVVRRPDGSSAVYVAGGSQYDNNGGTIQSVEEYIFGHENGYAEWKEMADMNLTRQSFGLVTVKIPCKKFN